MPEDVKENPIDQDMDGSELKHAVTFENLDVEDDEAIF